MIGASPHTYRQAGQAAGRASALVEAALNQATVVEQNRAPAILTLMHLAFRMGVAHKYLRALVADAKGEHYRDFTIAKRSGARRRIAVPEPGLMAIQRWIAREILNTRPIHDSAYAYAAGKSIRDCAERHVGAGWLLKFDIHDFFESIPEKSVYRVFRAIGYQPLVSFELARLCTRPWVLPPIARIETRLVRNSYKRGIEFYRRSYTGYVPQGAPTSPMLSNLVCVRLDAALSGFAATHNLAYTRYSDDLTFSGGAGSFDRAKAVGMVDDVRRILATHGFRLHEQKISIVPPGARKVVLGLLVDRGRLRLQRELRSRIADHVRGIETFGIASHAKARTFVSPTGMINHIAGLLRFARHIDAGFADPLRERLEAALVRENWTPSV